MSKKKSESHKVGAVMMETRGWSDLRNESWAKEGRSSEKSTGSKQMDSPMEPPKEINPADILIFAH